MKTAIKSFRIKREYLTDVPVCTPVVLTHEDGSITKGAAYGTVDHPEFTKLREKLGNLGYIQIERSFWNGDRVLKKFKLNGTTFSPGEKFVCACAMAIHLNVETNQRNENHTKHHRRNESGRRLGRGFQPEKTIQAQSVVRPHTGGSL